MLKMKLTISRSIEMGLALSENTSLEDNDRCCGIACPLYHTLEEHWVNICLQRKSKMKNGPARHLVILLFLFLFLCKINVCQ